MSSERALRAHLTTHPDDDESWLVFADLLTSRGDVRGRIIGLSQQLDTLGGIDGSGVRRLIALLEDAHRGEWLADLQLPEGVALTWRRGFVVEAVLPWRSDCIAFLAELIPHPSSLLQTLSLGWDDAPWHEGVERLVQAIAPGGITSLILSGCQIGDVGASLLARSEAVGRLVALELQRNQITARGAADLAAAELPSLERLELGENLLGGAGAEALAGADGLQQLAVLDLSANQIDAAGASALARAEHLGALKRLDLSHNRIGDAGALALSRSSALGGLVELRASSSWIGDAGAALLARAAMGSLCELVLSDNPIGDVGAEALAQTTLRSLTTLDLRSCPIGDVGRRRMRFCRALRDCTVQV